MAFCLKDYSFLQLYIYLQNFLTFLKSSGVSTAIESDSTGSFITVDEELADQDFILGIDFDMKVKLPSFFVKEEKKSDRLNIPMIENVYIDLYLSGRYSVDIERRGYDLKTVDLDTTIADIYSANSAAVDEISTQQIPVYSRGDYATLTITASDPLPASITSYRDRKSTRLNSSH